MFLGKFYEAKFNFHRAIYYVCSNSLFKGLVKYGKLFKSNNKSNGRRLLTDWVFTVFNHLTPVVFFYSPLKRQKTRGFFDVFGGHRKRSAAWNGSMSHHLKSAFCNELWTDFFPQFNRFHSLSMRISSSVCASNPITLPPCVQTNCSTFLVPSGHQQVRESYFILFS